ncbi:MAG: NYN domain-containing protein [Muribaculaceae bacterium]|nr:NYN domain-containing protein [Muribaculaceae bacterium]
MEKQRVIVYIDGFNFYYGLKEDLKWRKFYWLDVVALFQKFMKPNQELVAVKYFSARPNDPGKNTRQYAFFQANKENPKFHLILGKYLHKEITCYKCGNVIHTHEEKETDVRIATQIVADAYEKNCDVAIVVSADSDMIPAVELAKSAGQTVYIYFPPNHYSSNLASMANGRPIMMVRYKSRFAQSLLPDVVHLKSDNYDLRIPQKWKDLQG